MCILLLPHIAVKSSHLQIRAAMPEVCCLIYQWELRDYFLALLLAIAFLFSPFLLYLPISSPLLLIFQPLSSPLLFPPLSSFLPSPLLSSPLSYPPLLSSPVSSPPLLSSFLSSPLLPAPLLSSPPIFSPLLPSPSRPLYSYGVGNQAGH